MITTTPEADAAAPPTRTQRWAQAISDRIEQWPAGLRHALGLGVTLICVVLGTFIIITPFEFYAQCLFAVGCFAVALVLRKMPGRLTVLILIGLSLTASLRYMYWRVTATLDFESWLDIAFGYGLVLAELYALVVLIFGYLQTAWPLIGWRT